MNEPAETTAPRRRQSWPRAFAWAAGAVYLPLLVMCLYTTAFVDCSHCKKYCWLIAPVAPGVFFWSLAKSFVELPHATSQWGVVVTVKLSLLVMVTLAALLRVIGRWRWLLVLLILAASSFLARGILALLRS